VSHESLGDVTETQSGLRGLVASLSLPTLWPRRATPTAWFALVALAGFVAQMLPRPAGWTANYLLAEDGQVFLTQFLQRGMGTIFATYAGYLHVVPRLITATCSVTGPAGFTVCLDVSAGLVKVAAMAIAFPVLATYARSWRLFIPVGQQEVLGNITNLRWFLVAAAFFAVLGVFQRPGLAAYAGAIGLLAALSDPLALLLAPIALWRGITTPRWARLPSIALLIGVLVHLLFVDPSARGERGGIADLLEVPSQTIANLLVRGPLVTQIGMTWTQDLLRLVGVPLAVASLVITLILVVFAWRGRLPGDPAFRLAVLLAFYGMGILLVTLAFPASYIALPEIWSPSQPARYSALAALFLTPALMLLASLAWRSRRDPRAARASVVVVLACLVFGYVGDAGGDARHSSGKTWSELVATGRAECATTGIDPSLPTNPDYEGWTTTVTCEWLGVG
jgi:hypothetical protein